jgi:peptide subunit release factor 1 (eRF1)
MFDNRLQAKIIKLVDISYGGENGFNQAIELAAESLANVKFIQEKKLIGRYFDEISQDTGKYCFGVEDTLKVRIGIACIFCIFCIFMSPGLGDGFSRDSDLLGESRHSAGDS